MKINLSEVKFQPRLTEQVVTDNLYPMIAEIIYSTAKDLKQDEFARRLFAATGEIEVTETERQMIINCIQDRAYWLKQPILDILEGVK